MTRLTTDAPAPPNAVPFVPQPQVSGIPDNGLPDGFIPAEPQAWEPPAQESRRLVGGGPAGPEETVLTNEERDAFVYLNTTGKRTKVVDVLGHSVGIESLNVDDELLIGRFTKEFLDTEAYATARHVATAAAGIRTVDGRPIYSALSEDESPESIFQSKVTKLLKWYPVSITEIYRAILNLDIEFGELALKLGKLKG